MWKGKFEISHYDVNRYCIPQMESDVPLDDINAFRMNPRHNFIYFKPTLYSRLGQKFWFSQFDDDEFDPQNSYIARPSCNFFGMGYGAAIAAGGELPPDDDELPQRDGSYIVTRYRDDGIIFSVDAILHQGEPLWSSTAKCWRDGLNFSLFRINVDDPLSRKVERIAIEKSVAVLGHSYSGPVNIELFDDGEIIEMHLRLTSEFFPFYDKAMFPILDWSRSKNRSLDDVKHYLCQLCGGPHGWEIAPVVVSAETLSGNLGGGDLAAYADWGRQIAQAEGDDYFSADDIELVPERVAWMGGPRTFVRVGFACSRYDFPFVAALAGKIGDSIAIDALRRKAAADRHDQFDALKIP